MPVPQELTDAIAKIDTETNNLATFVQQLKDLIKTAMTSEDVAIVKGNLEAVAERLKAIGATPDVPVPPEPTPSFSRSRRG